MVSKCRQRRVGWSKASRYHDCMELLKSTTPLSQMLRPNGGGLLASGPACKVPRNMCLLGLMSLWIEVVEVLLHP